MRVLSDPPVSVAKAAITPKATDRRGAAIYCGVSLTKIDQWLTTGKLRAQKDGRRWIIALAELDRLLGV
jgi:excisionase family DNA binding protein